MDVDNVISNVCQLCGSSHPNPNATIQHYTDRHFTKQCEKDLNEFFPNGLRYCSKCNYNDETKSDLLKKALCHVCYHKLPEYIKDHQSEAAKPKTEATEQRNVTVVSVSSISDDDDDDIVALEECHNCNRFVQDPKKLYGNIYCNCCYTSDEQISKFVKATQDISSGKKKIKIELNQKKVFDYIEQHPPKVVLTRCQIPEEITRKKPIEEIVLDDDDDSTDFAIAFEKEVQPKIVSRDSKSGIKPKIEDLSNSSKKLKPKSKQPKETVGQELVSNPPQKENIQPKKEITDSNSKEISNPHLSTTKKELKIEPSQSPMIKQENSQNENSQSTSVEQSNSNDKNSQKSAMTPSTSSPETSSGSKETGNEVLIKKERQMDDASSSVNDCVTLESQGRPSTADLNSPPNNNVALEAMEVDNIVQDNQVSSSGQDNSPPESSNEDSEMLDNNSVKTPSADNVDNDETKIDESISVKQELQSEPQLDMDPNKIHFCDLCPELKGTNYQGLIMHLMFFHYEQELRQHLNIKPNDESFVCPKCNKGFLGEAKTYLIHYFLGHDEKFVVNLHEKTKSKNKDKDILDIDPDVLMAATQPPDDQQQCPICQFFFPDKSALDNHIQNKHSVAVPKKVCELCTNNDQKYTEDEFNQHLIDFHFAHIRDNLKKMPFPSTCKCKVPLVDFQFALKHMAGPDHNLFKDQYEKAVKTKERLAKELPNGQYFECSMCRNMGKKQIVRFSSVAPLRSHVALAHFKNLIQKDLKNSLEKHPVCPYPNCASMFNKLELLKQHYAIAHKGQEFNILQSINKCQVETCFQGPFNTFENLLNHLSYSHPEKIDEYLKRMKLDKTLVPLSSTTTYGNLPRPQQPSSQQPMNAKDLAIKNALNYHCPGKNLGGQVSKSVIGNTQGSTLFLGPPHEKVKVEMSPQPQIQQKPVLVISQNSVGVKVNPGPGQSLLLVNQSTSASSDPDQVRTVSVLKQFRKQQTKPSSFGSDLLPESQLRIPTIDEKKELAIFTATHTYCFKCKPQKQTWNYTVADIRMRKQLYFRHIFRYHLTEEMKYALFKDQIKARVKDVITCPIQNSEECKRVEPNFGSVLDHYSLHHCKIIEPAWQLAKFGTTSLTKDLENPENKTSDVTDVDLSKFTNIDTTLNINHVSKLMKYPFKTMIIQPCPCFLLSDKLTACHECWKVKLGQDQSDSICQFEGMLIITMKILNYTTFLQNPHIYLL